MASKDFLREKLPNGDFGDILIVNGDFVIGDSDNQHISDIVMSSPGWFKEFPLLGVDPANFLNGRGGQELKQQITIALQSDGYDTSTPKMQDFINSILNINQVATRG